jgi:hypothetical protein
MVQARRSSGILLSLSQRELPHDSRDVRPREELGHQLFDLTLRLVGRSLEQAIPVLSREVRHEPDETAQVQTPVPEHREQCGVAPRGAGDRDARIGLGLREVEPFGAVGEHRGRGLTGVEAARLDLADVGDEIGLDAA